MKKSLLYIGIFFLLLYSCEDIYVPDLESVDNFLVVEGNLVSTKQINQIRLYMSANFNQEELTYPPVTGAKVYLISESGSANEFTEISPGKYEVDHVLQNQLGYYLKIELNGEVYESGIQVVPDIPNLDSVYCELSNDVYLNEENEIVTDVGYRIFADIVQSGEYGNNYRFYARKILQYIDFYDTLLPGYPGPIELPIYFWQSYYPTGIFNIAGPAEYSITDDILKHPLEFYIKNTRTLIADTQIFAGWIYIIDQYNISDETYEYYKDMNSQLDSEGKIFDPIYVQAIGNIKCVSNPQIKVLGNFEIASYKEHRYFLKYTRTSEDFSLKKVPYFYEIPYNGLKKQYKPDFWETEKKTYPND